MDEIMGKSATGLFRVEDDDTAAIIRSGGMAVLATPALLAWMENVAYRLAQDYVQEGQTTVGVHADMGHLAATPVGMKVTVTATVIEVDGRKITFRIEASDEVEKIAACTHQRFVVHEQKFMDKCQSKKN